MPRAFRKRLARHNRQVVIITILMLAVCAAAWGIVYFAAYWFALVVQTVAHGADAPMPEHFPWRFLACVVISLVIAAAVGRARSFRERNLAGLRLMLELLLVLPATTLAAMQNLRAFVRMNDRETARAFSLLQHIETNGPQNLLALPREIPDPRELANIVIALQLLDLVVIRTGSEGWVITIRNDEARTIAQGAVRIRTR